MLTKAELELPEGSQNSSHPAAGPIVFGTAIWWYFLQRYELLYLQTHEPLFYGPGFVEMRVILPLLYVTIVGLVGLGLVPDLPPAYPPGREISDGFTGHRWLWAWVSATPSFSRISVQRYFVKPNEISREQPFMQKNIDATLRAYNVHQVETREVPVSDEAGRRKVGQIGASLRNIPVWDKEVLG